MINNNGKSWNRVLVVFLWGVVIAFASACAGGYAILDAKIHDVEEKRQIGAVRLGRMEECITTIKEDVRDLKSLTLKIYFQTKEK